MRFVMSNRRAGKFRETTKLASREALAMAFSSLAPGISVQSDSAPVDDLARRIVVFDADPSEITAKTASLGGDVLLEPEILHYCTRPNWFRPFGGVQTSVASPFPTGSGNTIKIRVIGNGVPLPNATVNITFKGSGTLRTSDSGRTNSQGRVSFSYSNVWTPSVLVAAPTGGFWTTVAFGPTQTIDVVCPPLPADGPIGWWHNQVGVTQFKVTRGRGIKVGVVDTGCGPHPALSHATLAGAFIDGISLPSADAADVDSHGSHVCGTIGAKPTASGQYAGIAPGASLFAARVFRDADSGANQGDIANAIDALSKTHEVDLINMSLGSPPGSPPSEIEKDAILDALQRGTLCICAAGNDNFDPVAYPSRFAECVSVAAIGTLGWGPAGSLASLRNPTGQTDRFGNGNLYLANFSNFGEGLDCCGPGVGIIATVPERFGLTAPYAVMDGTSMASPVVTGTLAAILAGNAAYKALPRDQTRAENARDILKTSLKHIGLVAQFEGGGIPSV